MLSYRDEYKEALGNSRGNFHVLAHEWLTNQLESNALQSAVKILPNLTTLLNGIYSLIVLNPPLPNSPRMAAYFCAIWTNLEGGKSRRVLWWS